jgi:hypothetical protein
VHVYIFGVKAVFTFEGTVVVPAVLSIRTLQKKQGALRSASHDEFINRCRSIFFDLNIQKIGNYFLTTIQMK